MQHALQPQPRQSTRRVLRVLLGATFLLVLVMAASAAWGLNAIADGMREELALEQGIIAAAYELELAVVRQSLDAHRYLLTGDKDSLDQWQTDQATYVAKLQALERVERKPEGQRALAEIDRAEGRWARVLDQAVAVQQAGRGAEARALVEREAWPLRDQVRKALEGYLAAARADAVRAHARVIEQEARVRDLLTGTTVLCLPFVGLFAWFASRRVLHPLSDLERSAVRLGGGDLSARADASTNDEFGAVAGAFNKMAEQVEDSISTMHESELRIRATLDALQEGIVVVDRDRHVLVFNPGAERVLGLERAMFERLGGLPASWQLLRGDGSPFPSDELPAFSSLRTGRPCADVELGIARPDAAVSWLSVACQPLFRAGEERPYAVVTSFFDVTERRRASEQARQADLLIQSVVDYAIIMLDPEGRVVSWNKGAEAVKGYTEREALGLSFLDFYEQEDRESGRPQDLLQQAIAHGSAEDQGWRLRKGGQRFWADVTITALRDAGGSLVGFAKVTRDLTERKLAEERLEAKTAALARQERLLSKIVENVPAAIAYVDRDLVYRWNNPAHCKLVGLPKAAIVDHRVFDVLPGAEAQLEPRYQRVLATGEPHFEAALPLTYQREGRQVESHWDVAYIPIGEPGQVEGVLILSTEVSERVARERAQQEVIDHLKGIDRMKDEFLSVLSHELRTPINAIMGFGSILEDEISGPLNPQQLTYVRKILGGSEVLLALVNDLLDMGRIRAGKLSLERQELDFAGVAANVVDGMAGLAGGKRQVLACTIPPDLPRVSGDAQRLGQILTNLIGNAIKFTPEGGRIDVRACELEDALRCEVHDSGIGIATEQLGRLFQPFSQLDSSYTRRAGGTGLGLSICKALVEAHGGEIGVVSTPGVGSTFWFTLPLAGSPQPIRPER